MKFLKHDFTRYFTIGFMAGTIAIAAMTGNGIASRIGGAVAGEMVPAAVAAETAHRQE